MKYNTFWEKNYVAFTLDNALEEQIKFKNEIHRLKESTKPKPYTKKKKKFLTFENTHRLLRGR